MSDLHSCHACQHLHREAESWEMPHIWWWECSARPSMENLKSFPFRRTKCSSWEPVHRRASNKRGLGLAEGENL